MTQRRWMVLAGAGPGLYEAVSGGPPGLVARVRVETGP